VPYVVALLFRFHASQNPGSLEKSVDLISNCFGTES
jgi:hypothetical protein